MNGTTKNSKSYNILYTFIDSNNNVLYVGKTSNFEHRVKMHKSRSKWYGEATRVVILTFNNGYIASTLEPLLVAFNNPKHNKDLKNKEIHWGELHEVKKLIYFISDKYPHEKEVIVL